LLEDVLRRRRKSAVPVSLEMDKDRRTLLISGPNTGGKTVTLKTVGLLSLMAQSGLPVPAVEAEFPLFAQVLADIGDYQSIQENLSTVSAHISNIRDMALDVTPDSLVLLDELGEQNGPEPRDFLHFLGGELGAFVDASSAPDLKDCLDVARAVPGRRRTRKQALRGPRRGVRMPIARTREMIQ